MSNIIKTGETDSDWFVKKLGARGNSQADLARHMDFDRSTMHGLLHGRRQPRLNEIKTIAEFLDEPILEVLYRVGFDLYDMVKDNIDISATKFAEIQEVDVRGGMGGGGVSMLVNHTDDDGTTNEVDGVKDTWGLPQAYTDQMLNVNPADARIIEVQGDSMEPTLRPGDRVMIDTRLKAPSPPGVFALWDGIGVVVKRIEHIINSDPPAIRIQSDNKHHGDATADVAEINIIGRVVWAARKI
jgi:transcriptional regulator with XRE-family HTH domain